MCILENLSFNLYLNSFIFLFQNISGTFTALINVISLMLAPNARTSAIYYFIAALFILLACFDSFFALPLNVINWINAHRLFLTNNFWFYRDSIVTTNNEFSAKKKRRALLLVLWLARLALLIGISSGVVSHNALTCFLYFLWLWASSLPFTQVFNLSQSFSNNWLPFEFLKILI